MNRMLLGGHTACTNKCETKSHNKEAKKSPLSLRIKDRHGHYLGDAHGGFIRIYCKRCREFFEVQFNQLDINNS